MSDYSKKSLADKLGIKEKSKIRVINPPKNYFELLDIPKTFVITEHLVKADFIHCFVSSVNELEHFLPEFKNEIHKDGMLWISWPKKSSGISTDVNENIIRKNALRIGLVDVKVCAIDETWSGLKL